MVDETMTHPLWHCLMDSVEGSGPEVYPLRVGETLTEGGGWLRDGVKMVWQRQYRLGVVCPERPAALRVQQPSNGSWGLVTTVRQSYLIV